MKFLHKLRIISLLSLVTTVSAFSQNYEISISLKSNNDTVLLCHYFANSDITRARIDATVVLKNGKGVLKSDKKLAKGVYFIYNDRKKFDIIIGDNQKFGIVTDTIDFINHTKFTNSPDNDVFYEFQRYNAEGTKQFIKLNEQFGKTTNEDERRSLIATVDELRGNRTKFIEKLIADNSHMYVSKFLKALIPVETYVPEPPRDEEGKITDREFQYRWYRANFFSNLNIFDPDMLRTPFYEDKLLEYVTRVIPQITDTVCVEIDKILTKVQKNDELFRFVMATLYNHYRNSMEKVIVDKGVVPENVWFHISDKWFIPFSFWSTDESKESLRERLNKIGPNLIGNQAPPMEMLMVLPPEHFKAAALDTAIKNDLHAGRMVEDFRKELKSKFTVLFFWDYTCGHCKKAIMELYELWEESKDKGMNVIAIQMVVSKEAKAKSIDYINEQNLFGIGWTNAWSPYSYKYKELYNTTLSPTVYLLDEKGVILLRRDHGFGVENLKDFFKNL